MTLYERVKVYAGISLVALGLSGCPKSQEPARPPASKSIPSDPNDIDALVRNTVAPYLQPTLNPKIDEPASAGGSGLEEKLDLSTPEAVFNLYWDSIGHGDIDTLKQICTPEWRKRIPTGDSWEKQQNEVAATQRKIFSRTDEGSTTTIIYDWSGAGKSGREKFHLNCSKGKYFVRDD